MSEPAYSADVKLFVNIAGVEYPLAQMGKNFAILRQPILATVIMRTETAERVWGVEIEGEIRFRDQAQ